MGFHELIAQAKEPGDEGLPASIYDDLTAEYDGLAEGSNAKVSELSERVKAYESEISRLKSTNYDLLMSSAGDNGDSGDDTDKSDKSVSSIDDLFN